MEADVSERSVAVTRSGLPGSGVERLARRVPVTMWQAARTPSAGDLAALVAGADAMLAIGADPVDARVIRSSPALRVIALASAGYNNVDLEAARERGVAVTHTPGVLHETTAEFTIALALAARRRLAEGDRFVRAGGWDSQDMSLLLGMDLFGGRMGLVGYGEIGRAVARRAHALGMEVVHHSRRRDHDAHSRWVLLDELLATADVVSLHVPLTPETTGLIGAPQLRRMKPTATLVNTARGAVVDEEALCRALREGWIHSAALDVFATEPLARPDHPLLALPNCIATPHMAAASAATRARMVDLAVDNILAVLDGRTALTPVPDPGAVDGPVR
jgi:lactate dehydrogenase-like 2-hydroxyacid dehydrogenase